MRLVNLVAISFLLMFASVASADLNPVYSENPNRYFTLKMNFENVDFITYKGFDIMVGIKSIRTNPKGENETTLLVFHPGANKESELLLKPGQVKLSNGFKISLTRVHKTTDGGEVDVAILPPSPTYSVVSPTSVKAGQVVKVAGTLNAPGYITNKIIQTTLINSNGVESIIDANKPYVCIRKCTHSFTMPANLVEGSYVLRFTVFSQGGLIINKEHKIKVVK